MCYEVNNVLVPLARMNIPQLNVNPIAETVKTADNQSVSFFINFHPATNEDVSGLNPSDVKRVRPVSVPLSRQIVPDSSR